MKSSLHLYKKITFLLLILFLTTNFSHAFDLDETVDDTIRKNYNDTKLINDLGIKFSEPDENLPDLPNISKTEKKTNATYKAVTTIEDLPTINTTPTPVYNGGTIKIKSGTTFVVKNSGKINDWLAKGNTVYFKSQKTVTGKGYTIPAGTSFIGKIVDVHQPQITCNGGLVAIKINSMKYKGQTIPINAYVTRANDKIIFLNNIKGDRTYLKTVWKKGNWGRALFSRMLTLTINLGGEGSTLILSPFPFLYGTICLGLNTLTSPICAFFSKGGHVSIPANSNFKIKLIDETYID